MTRTTPSPARAAKRTSASSQTSTHRSATKAAKDQAAHTVMVFQGGGALGAYQAGVFEVLAQHGYQPDWMVGTSIGAINSAIIAGNPPEQRTAKLRAFWDLVAQRQNNGGFSYNPFMAWLQPWVAAGQVLETVTQGISGFFVPRPPLDWDVSKQVAVQNASFYDTSPLQATLEKLVDFDYLAQGPVRLSVCAVNVSSGELTVFDSTKQRLDARHIMASGALPPGFPPIVIDGHAYWDGGIYSNTPMDIVLDDAERRDTLCFMVDLWDPTEALPQSIGQAMTRQKDIQYSSRSLEHLQDHEKMQNMRHAIEQLAARLPATARKDPLLAQMAALGCGSTINVVRLILKALPGEDQNKDIDFAQSTLSARWQAGATDAKRALAHKSWLQAPPPGVGLAIHELPQLED